MQFALDDTVPPGMNPAWALRSSFLTLVERLRATEATVVNSLRPGLAAALAAHGLVVEVSADPVGETLPIGPSPLPAGERCTALTVAAAAATGWTAVTADGFRVTVPHGALDPGLRTLRAGQRLHGRLRGAEVLDAWL